MNLLIVVDNGEMRRLIKSLVEDLADVICECSDGSQALAAFEAQRPDWVLMDLKMSEMDGLAATRLIKSADPAAKIIIVTDYDDVQLRVAASVAGACYYVVKESLPDLRSLLQHS
ncbi:MAG TPA: response regulator [Pyrinomonadaceae bacterium]|nr:response regulator [Pyrinomonadaceae bacterium]